MDSRKQDCVPEQRRPDQIEAEMANARPAEKDEGGQNRRGGGEGGKVQPVAVDERDDRHRTEIVGDRDGREEQAQRGRHAPAEQRHDAEREGDIGRGRDRPAAGERGIGARAGEIEEGRGRHSGRRCGQRQPPGFPVGKIAADQLALYLEADEQEEQRHRPVVDPQMDIHRPEPRRQQRSGFEMEQAGIGAGKRAVGDDERKRGRADQQQPAERLAVEEPAQHRSRLFGDLRRHQFRPSGTSLAPRPRERNGPPIVPIRETFPGCERFTVNGRLSGWEGHAVRRYRYRTSVLTGPWRDVEDDAARDAIKAKQAIADDDQPTGIKWIVPGQIEERISEKATSRLDS